MTDIIQPSLFDQEVAAEAGSIDGPEIRTPNSDEVARHAAVVGRHATHELYPQNDKAFPVDDDGYINPSAIEPGMVDPLWGAVTGKFNGEVKFDITVAPGKIPRSQRPIAAVREYARLVNARTRAIEGNNLDKVDQLDAKIAGWLDWSLEKKLRKEV